MASARTTYRDVQSADGAAEAVFSPAESRPTERIYRLSRQVLEFRRAVAPLTEMLDRLAADSLSIGMALRVG